jgi:SEC-C motif-containing protein
MSESPCPCGSRRPYADCCEPPHLGTAQAATAEALMRSRYSASCLGKAAYLIATHHPSKRGTNDPAQLQAQLAETEWIQLRIVATQLGMAADDSGEVEFVATCRSDGFVRKLHERSRFVKEDDRWLYVDGEHQNLPPVSNPGRNEPCWCGSGKKYKKCHG